MEASQFLDMAQVFLYNSSPSGRWANEGVTLVHDPALLYYYVPVADTVGKADASKEEIID
mgnify:CR=1 FL=1